MQPKDPLLGLLYRPARHLFSNRTLQLLWFDLLRLRARLKRWGQHGVVPVERRLHLGCGDRRLPAWLNVDVMRSDYDVDLGCGRLPWKSEVFEAVVSQHVIEHLDLHEQLLPLFAELYRVLQPNGEIWLSCPDLEKVCRSYLEHGMRDLLEDRQARDAHYSLQGAPAQQLINDLFHQFGQHKNLFDFALLRWCLGQAGFTGIVQVTEAALLARYPECPVRHDDLQSLYVSARKP